MQKLARACYHRRRSVLAVWVVLLIGLSILASSAGGVFKVQNGLPGSESQHAFDLLKQKGFGERAGIQAQIAFTSPDGVKSPAVQQAMEQLFTKIEHDVSAVTIASPYAAENARQISRDGTIAYAELQFQDRSSAAYQDRGRQDHRAAGPGEGRRAAGRARQPDLLEAGVRQRGDRADPRDDHPARGVRFAARDGTADRDRARRHRVRRRGGEARRQRHQHAGLHDPGRAHDLDRRRDRLRAVHRDAVPGGARLRP